LYPHCTAQPANVKGGNCNNSFPMQFWLSMPWVVTGKNKHGMANKNELHGGHEKETRNGKKNFQMFSSNFESKKLHQII
jgi:hypothetical protein